MDPLRAHLAAVGLARAPGGLVMPTLYMGTERERSPAMLESIGFRATDYVVGMDFPRNTPKSLYACEEVFALALREHLELLVGAWAFPRVVIVNGHGAENHLATIGRLRREISERTGARIVLVMPMDGYPEGRMGARDPGGDGDPPAALPRQRGLSGLPAQGVPLENTAWAVVDDGTFRGRPTAGHNVRPEEDPRRADAARGERLFARTADALAAWLKRELALP